MGRGVSPTWAMGAETWESVEFGVGGRAVVDDGME